MICSLTCRGRLRDKLLQGSQVNRIFLGVGRWTSKSGTPWHRDRLTPWSLCVVPSCGNSFREHSQDLPTELLQLQHWLKTEPLCGVNTNSKKLALLWEFYNLVEKNGRKGILVLLFYRKPQHFETWAAIHRGIYLGA